MKIFGGIRDLIRNLKLRQRMILVFRQKFSYRHAEEGRAS